MKDRYQPRQYTIQGVVIATALVLIFRSFQLQILNENYKNQQGFLDARTQYPSRGLIYDRTNKLLVHNEATYDLMVTYNQVKNLDTAKFCRILDIDRATFIKNMTKDFKHDKRFSPNVPFEFIRRLPADIYARLQESLYEFNGFYVELKNVRGYDIPAAAHAFGYLGEVSPKILDTSTIYKRGDYMGITGIERSYEEHLRGVKGVRYILRDNMGRVQGAYKNGSIDKPSISGLDLVSSLDGELQTYGEELMRNKKGAVVAIEPSTGEILAFISAPTYDPNLLTATRGRGDAFKALMGNDSLKPMFNRALQAQYPPGSIFKTAMALIALADKVITPEKAVGCAGGYALGSLFVGCHGHPSAGNVSAAIQHSCNAYFCQVFKEEVEQFGGGFKDTPKGVEKWYEHLSSCGFGRLLGVDIPGEMPGSIPHSPYYDKIYGKGRWKASMIISLGIGQGELLITPLQMANLATIIANRGFYYIPHFAKEFKNADNDLLLKKYREKQNSSIDAEHFTHVVNGMEQVVIAGTARVAFLPDIPICGKTGTVQNPHGKDHSTFIAFAPKDNPKIAMAVFVENAGFGAEYAAPIASLMIEKYLTRTIRKERKYLEERMMNANLIDP